MALDIIKLFVSIIICQIVGLINIVLNSKSLEPWFVALKKPPFLAPHWVISPMLGLINLLLGISFFIVWSEGIEIEGVKLVMILFGVHTLLGILVLYLTYVKKSFTLAVITLLLSMLVYLMIFVINYVINPIAAFILIPESLGLLYFLIEIVSVGVLNPKTSNKPVKSPEGAVQPTPTIEETVAPQVSETKTA